MHLCRAALRAAGIRVVCTLLCMCDDILLRLLYAAACIIKYWISTKHVIKRIEALFLDQAGKSQSICMYANKMRVMLRKSDVNAWRYG